jgi:hypothetical protein
MVKDGHTSLSPVDPNAATGLAHFLTISVVSALAGMTVTEGIPTGPVERRLCNPSGFPLARE